MVFSGIVFLFRFVPIFFFLYAITRGRMRNLILFLGSLFFYAWGEPVYVVLMLFSTVSDFCHGIWIEKSKTRNAARGFLTSSVLINLGLLGFFKYSGLDLPLPIGISFYTFQTMSYSIDVYRGEVRAQKNLLDFGVFVTMFPQLIAGPIVKYRDVALELADRYVTIRDIKEGIVRFSTGLAKKVFLANGIGQLFTQITELNELPSLTAWIGILAYTFQIYFDFSGYSDMAIGLGRCMGFHFPENFNYPYISRSVTEFWRRWHMSLSSWFREYVYIPLGGNRKGFKRQLLNIFIVWSLTGIWHGAGLSFLLWGMWFAIFLVLEKTLAAKSNFHITGFGGWIYTMLVVVLGWCFFSLESNELLFRFLKAMIGLGKSGLYNTKTMYLLTNYYRLFLILIVAATPIGKWTVTKISAYCSHTKITSGLYTVFETAFILVILLLAVAGIVDASYNPFLYFRF